MFPIRSLTPQQATGNALATGFTQQPFIELPELRRRIAYHNPTEDSIWCQFRLHYKRNLKSVCGTSQSKKTWKG